MSEKATAVRPLFDSALAARNVGRFEEAKALCLEALELLDESDTRLLAVVHGELGYIHRKQQEPDMAVRHYEQAVKFSPRSELASLGLFHARVEQDNWMGALSEAVRFLAGKDSDAYRELLSRGFSDDLPEPQRILADRARALLSEREKTK